MNSFVKAAFIAMASLVASIGPGTIPARALVEIDVNRGVVEPLPIAVTDFLSGGDLGVQITDVITAAVIKTSRNVSKITPYRFFRICQ